MAVTLGGLTIAIALTHVPLDILTHQVSDGEQVTIDWLTATGSAVPAAATGAVVAARRPGNPLGWLLLALFAFAGVPSADYAFWDYGMHHGTLPLPALPQLHQRHRGRQAAALAVADPGEPVADYPCVPVTAKSQDCAGQKVLLLAMTYGELSTMVPLQAFHAPLLTAP
jgi:hypothetical protein